MTPLSKEQWLSVVRNAVFAFAATFSTSLSVSGELNRSALFSAATAGLMAAFKVVEKLFTKA